MAEGAQHNLGWERSAYLQALHRNQWETEPIGKIHEANERGLIDKVDRQCGHSVNGIRTEIFDFTPS